jgi:hypothetical protein
MPVALQISVDSDSNVGPDYGLLYAVFSHYGGIVPYFSRSCR